MDTFTTSPVISARFRGLNRVDQPKCSTRSPLCGDRGFAVATAERNISHNSNLLDFFIMKEILVEHHIFIVVCHMWRMVTGLDNDCLDGKMKDGP